MAGGEPVAASEVRRVLHCWPTVHPNWPEAEGATQIKRGHGQFARCSGVFLSDTQQANRGGASQAPPTLVEQANTAWELDGGRLSNTTML